MKFIKKWIIIGSLPIIAYYLADYYLFYNSINGDLSHLEYNHLRNIGMFVYLFRWAVIGYFIVDVIRFLIIKRRKNERH